nr:hypothetical protein Q903MT_gene406 [Picea sitchensis]
MWGGKFYSNNPAYRMGYYNMRTCPRLPRSPYVFNIYLYKPYPGEFEINQW